MAEETKRHRGGLPTPSLSFAAPAGAEEHGSFLAETKVPLLTDKEISEVGEDVPLQGFGSLADWKEEARQQWTTAIPASGMHILIYLQSLVSILFVGHLGSLELAAAALATSVVNTTGFSVLEGLTSGLETLCGQAHGAGQARALGIILQRALLLLSLCCLPIVGLYLQAEKLLVLCGQDPELAAAAGHYIRALIPALFAMTWSLVFMVFLQSQSVVQPLVWASAACLAVHVPVNYLLIHSLGLGFIGAAWATSISSIVEVLLLIAYVLVGRRGIWQKTWGGFSWKAFQDWGSFMALALPSCAMMCLELWYFEILVLLAGLLPHPHLQVSAMAICFNMVNLCFRVPLGLGTAASIRVSNALGAEKPGRARRAVHVATGLGTVVGLLECSLLLVFRHWAAFFTHEQKVIDLVAGLTPFLVATMFGIIVQAILTGVLRGAGQQLAGFFVNLVAYYFVALPLAGLCAFKLQWAIEGLWWGLTTGAIGQLIVLLWLTGRADWHHQVQRAKDRLQDVS